MWDHKTSRESITFLVSGGQERGFSQNVQTAQQQVNKSVKCSTVCYSELLCFFWGGWGRVVVFFAGGLLFPNVFYWLFPRSTVEYLKHSIWRVRLNSFGKDSWKLIYLQHHKSTGCHQIWYGFCTTSINIKPIEIRWGNSISAPFFVTNRVWQVKKVGFYHRYHQSVCGWRRWWWCKSIRGESLTKHLLYADDLVVVSMSIELAFSN